MKLVESMEVLENKPIAKNIYRMILKGNNVKLMNKAGQFVGIKIDTNESLILRRPISICEVSKDANNFTIIYRVQGKGTELLSKKQIGSYVNVFGPLGNGFNVDNIKKGKTALLVGGGIGTPPLFELAKKLKDKDIKVISVLGFNSKEDVFYEEEFKQFGEVHISTMDGSYGYKGNVINLIIEKNLNFDYIFACGPKAMLKVINDRYVNTKEGYISLEEKMACGVGACMGCVCKDKEKDGNKRVCADGPVFKLGEIEI